MLHAAQKLEAAGPRLGHPHSTAVQGEVGKGVRELRPRAARSRWRPIYRRVSPSSFAILAIGPEAQIDRRGFDAAVAGRSRGIERLRSTECWGLLETLVRAPERRVGESPPTMSGWVSGLGDDRANLSRCHARLRQETPIER